MTWENILKEDDWTDLETENQGGTFDTKIITGRLYISEHLDELNQIYNLLIDISKEFDGEDANKPETQKLADIYADFNVNLMRLKVKMTEKIKDLKGSE